MKTIRREGLAMVVLLALSHSPLQAVAKPQGTWTQVATTGPAFSIFTPPSMAYDSLHSRTVLVGGATGGETWEWDGISWTQRAGLPARTRHAVAYDSQRGRTVLFGGTDANSNALGDTWEWDGSVWIQVASTGPGTRYDHAMAYDSQRGKTVLFGGNGGGGTWEWDGTTWTQVATSGPPYRLYPSMAYDNLRGKIVMHGGSVPGSTSLRDTWEWNGSTWTQVATDGPPAAPFSSGAAVFDNARTIVIGGSSLHLWSGAPWATLASTPSLFGAVAAYDSARAKYVAVGFMGSFGGTLVPGTFEMAQLEPPTFTPFGSGCAGPNGVTRGIRKPGRATLASDPPFGLRR